MRIEKVYNNNVVQSRDEISQEIILIGKGLGFQKKTGDQIDTSKIEKTFVLQEDAETFINLYQDLSSQESELVIDIISLAEDRLGKKFQSNLYITLADHLHFAFERIQNDLNIKNPLSWEVQKLYAKEYEVGKEALILIRKRMGIDLPNDEAASIALHLINAQKESGLMEETIKMVNFVQDILNIVKIHFAISYDEESISYHRFVTHLQYFAQRVINKQKVNDDDIFLFNQVKASYPDSLACAQRIQVYVENTYQYDVSLDEIAYLTIHIQRLVNN
ncbi:PRD domain-containing protein [Ignavigranum ruoffiae]|uniref:BglG family transcription antiterminator LicT n=1 Tax=Ignavigranum ruoffiae TaxID=89093 RepID=UPI00204CBF8B|nr:PRD domain-containing protein [Ignavigranum ruoffiae]UPQ85145.1 PRD domain-containing protein [Ignavigranum ruoffiae]